MVVLDYKVDDTDIEPKSMMQLRQKKIETLIADDSICCTIREKYSRFYEMKTIDEMKDEFDLINEQIRINRLEIHESKEECGYASIEIGYMESEGPFKFGGEVYYCYWKPTYNCDTRLNLIRLSFRSKAPL